MEKLAQALIQLNSLNELAIGSNNIGEDGGLAISIALSDHKQMTIIGKYVT